VGIETILQRRMLLFRSTFNFRRHTEATFSLMTGLSSLDFKWIEDGLEHISMYSPGGYHPVSLGDVLHERYCIIHKLGHGGYSTVWLARDTQQEQYVAVKICIADALPHETKVIRDLSATSSDHPGKNSVPHLLDEFTVDGPNGTHTCFTTPLTQSSLRVIGEEDLFTVEVARALSAGLVQALSYIHSQGYVHGGSSLIFSVSLLWSAIESHCIQTSTSAMCLFLFQEGFRGSQWMNSSRNAANQRLILWYGGTVNRFRTTSQRILFSRFSSGARPGR
jgi:hypothetical protein